MKEVDEERCRLSKEKNEVCRKHQDLSEVVSDLRAELMANERKIRELESELSVVSLQKFLKTFFYKQDNCCSLCDSVQIKVRIPIRDKRQFFVASCFILLFNDHAKSSEHLLHSFTL